ncbi:MAG: 16S rRNA (uracil(1498)-N(3))-methyltransferase [Deltaproteobacteria bacterium]|jgi:16S rRNA (uracil1498-N3)-methyltransferase|nr:16S rRNA (uracil(1498)-N(3))-methyltransferase [Deltaproteobacteria bacterium]
MNALPRFFVLPETLRSGEVLELTGAISHHVQHVLRLQTGEEVLLLDGQGTCCRARLGDFQRPMLRAYVLERYSVADTALPLTLIQALPKSDKFDFVLQKGTELGITAFQPVLTARSVPRPDEKRISHRQNRWQKIIQDAARQSQRNHLPSIRQLSPLAEALPAEPGHLKLALWESGARPLVNVLPKTSPEGVTILVGPEGGLDRSEIAAAEEAGFVPVHLGPRILRTETAALAIIPILQYLYGDWMISPGD